MNSLVTFGFAVILCCTSIDGFGLREQFDSWKVQPRHYLQGSHHDWPNGDIHEHHGPHRYNNFDPHLPHADDSSSEEYFDSDKSGENENQDENYRVCQEQEVAHDPQLLHNKRPIGFNKNPIMPHHPPWTLKLNHPPWTAPGNERTNRIPTTNHRVTTRPTLKPTTWYNPIHTQVVTQSILPPGDQNTEGAKNLATRPLPDTGSSNVPSSTRLLTCIRSCTPATVYSPLCGTDGITYNNMAEIQCVQSCGVNIKVQSNSPCASLLNNKAGPTTSTPVPDLKRTVTLTRYQLCMKQCELAPNYNPVCGTDLVTYINIDRLNCAKQCGNAVDILCNKDCPSCPGTFPSKITPPPSTTLNLPVYSPEIRQCMKACPPSIEFKPVCGSDGITYGNPGKLLCAQMCGIDVKATRFSVCDFTTISPEKERPTPSVSIPTNPLNNCIRNCPVTSEYNPVCGSNGITYANPSRIECAKSCGVRVRETPCVVTPDPVLVPNITPRPTTTSTKLPVNTFHPDLLSSIFDIPGASTIPPDYDILETDIRFGEKQTTDTKHS